jgi:hypothetical protein
VPPRPRGRFRELPQVPPRPRGRFLTYYKVFPDPSAEVSHILQSLPQASGKVSHILLLQKLPRPLAFAEELNATTARYKHILAQEQGRRKAHHDAPDAENPVEEQ